MSVGGPFPGPAMTMYGDGASLLDHATGGNNTLISGAANDIMWGDAATVSPTATTGPNLFVFSPPNGNDSIMDFKPGLDHIELKAYGFTSFNSVADLITNTAQGALITFDANDSILVANDHHLTSGDFIFV
jgi:Ca2+-binding RTX toxin-like protein